MMIPLRRALIKDQHGYLKYPEGTACAEVLKAGASKESREASHEGDTHGDDSAALQGGKIISIGFAIGFIFNTLMQVFSFWKGTPTKQFSDTTFKGGSVSLANDPTLLGVGYIIGPRIAGLMMGGGILSYLVLIPMIKFFGGEMTTPVAPALGKTIAEMDPDGVRGAYVLYIGAGAVAMAGIISLARSLPTIWHGLKGGLADLRGGSTNADGSALPRTDQDLSMKWVVVGVIALIAAIMLFPQLGLSVFVSPVVSFFGAILIIILGFLFVTVSSRLTGEVGSSSNPISGMTVATLLITCLVFLALGWTAADPYFVTALVDRRHRLHRRVERRHDLAGPQDRFLGRLDAAKPADRDPGRSSCIRARARVAAYLPEQLPHLLSKGRSEFSPEAILGYRRPAFHGKRKPSKPKRPAAN